MILSLTIEGLIFEIIGASTLIYTIFIKPKESYISESSYYNETLMTDGSDIKELNTEILENNVDLWKNSFCGLIFFIIGFILQVIGQFQDCNNYFDKNILLIFKISFFLIIPICLIIFNFFKNIKIRNLLELFHKKHNLSLGRKEIINFLMKYYNKKKLIRKIISEEEIIKYFEKLRT